MAADPPPRSLMRLGWRLHKLVWRLSGGRLGRRGGGMRTMELTTTGHRSGRPRSILIWFLDHRDGYAVAGTNAGADYDPAWVKNLRANPHARVTVDGDTFDVVARFLSGEEHAQVWEQFTGANRAYAGYGEQLTRPIPLVALERYPDQARG